MEKKTQKLLDTLDAQLAKLEVVLKAYPEDILETPPSPGKWSAKQLVEHLRRSEELSMTAVEKYYTRGKGAPKAGIGSFMRARLLHISLSSSFKFKSPPAVNTDTFPVTTVPLDTLFTNWKVQRQSLRASIMGFTPDEMRRVFYKHPYAGLLSIYQMLGFFSWHLSRHAKQAMRAAHLASTQKVPDTNQTSPDTRPG